MTTAKKIWKFLSSMQFALFLLVILAAACAAASFITQGLSYEQYAGLYGERAAGLILALHLDDAFHSLWFVVMAAFLLGNLMLCNLTRLPSLLTRTKNALNPQTALSSPGEFTEEGVEAPEKLFARLHFPKPQRGTLPDGRPWLFAGKNAAGLWGAWVCHVGIFLLILGFGLGQATYEEYSVYGVAGQTKALGETGLLVTIDDFQTTYLGETEEAVDQYISALTVREPATGKTGTATVSVNNPAALFGYRFYQNSTGWAARLNIAKDGAPLQSEVVCAGDYLPVRDKPELILYLAHFYPDYALQPGVGPTTLTNELKNPAYLYMVYFRGELLGMNVLLPGEELTIDEYTVTFTEPQSFTLIQVKRDAYSGLALLGGLVVMLGLFLAFYLQPKRLWAVQEGETWTVHGACPKGGVLFREQVHSARKES